VLREMLVGELSQPRVDPIAVKLVMLVTRGDDDRLSGTVRLAEGGADREFSGTLELMRVFEDLVPTPLDVVESAPDRACESRPPERD
jgi:hypothetical protein